MTAETGADSPDTWTLVEDRLDLSPHAETVFALTNGALGVRGGIEECASSSQASFLAAAWDRYPLSYHERHFGFARTTDTRLPVADATAIRIRLGDIALSSSHSRCEDHRRSLDLRRGCILRTTRWQVPGAGTILVTAERMVSLTAANLSFIRMSVESIDFSGVLTLESAICVHRRAAGQREDPRMVTGSEHHLHTDGCGATKEAAWIGQRTETNCLRVHCLQTHRSNDLRCTGADHDHGTVRQTFEAQMHPGTRRTIEKFVVHVWNANPDVAATDLMLEAGALAAVAQTKSFDGALCEQARVLERFWNDAGLRITGSPEVERALHYNQFQLFQGASRCDSAGIAAKGLTGEGYEGHVFWDTETFILPALVFQAPSLARPALLWRIRLLDRARAHARELNLVRGALYPWRTISGDECSAHYPSGSAQFHINAAIAYALVLYLHGTGDEQLLANGGAELLFETARIWPQLGYFNPRRSGAFCIPTVTGPDEYTALVDNNFYTNHMAQWHLRQAVHWATRMRETQPSAFGDLCQRIGLDETELQEWACIAERMYFAFDPGLGIIAQDDGFLDKPRWNLAATPANQFPLLLHQHPITLYRHQVCKQADVLQGLLLAGEDIAFECKRRTFDYYEHVTAHDSTLSAACFCIVAADIGYRDHALGYFHAGLMVDLRDLHHNTCHGLHMAAIAGSWLSLAWGFGGLRVAQDGSLHLNPSIPRQWSGFEFRFLWRGRRLQLVADQGGARCRLLSGDAMTIHHRGVPMQLGPEGAIELGMRRERGAPARHKAVIFDLDGVLVDSARLHYRAWKQLADEIGVPFDPVVNLRLKGVDRQRSLDIVLEKSDRAFSHEQKQMLAARKNEYFRGHIAKLGPDDLLPGARRALLTARGRGARLALASASLNASALIGQLGISGLFDHVVDPQSVCRGKPAPDLFLTAARALCVPASACIGVEDAKAGIDAIKAAGMYAIGVGDAQELAGADSVVASVAELAIEHFLDARDDDSLLRPPLGERVL